MNRPIRSVAAASAARARQSRTTLFRFFHAKQIIYALFCQRLYAGFSRFEDFIFSPFIFFTILMLPF